LKPTSISVTLAVLLSATSAYAAPISAFSELEVNHSFVVNNGNSPEGIDIGFGPNSLTIERDATTFVDHPDTVYEDDINVVVGNAFTDPPIAAQGSWLSTAIRPNGTDSALAFFSSDIVAEDDPADDNFDITRRSVRQYGEANAVIVSEPIAASAASSERITRSYLFENTTNDLISFNIAGQFDAALGAQYTGIDGFARASAVNELLFTPSAGAEITFFPVSPYLTDVVDADPGAFAFEQLDIGSNGFVFTASTSATGMGGTTTALVDAEFRYVFSLSLEGGASVVMDTNFGQANAVDYTPQPRLAPVPVPASLPLLIGALGGFLTLRRRSETR